MISRQLLEFEAISSRGNCSKVVRLS